MTPSDLIGFVRLCSHSITFSNTVSQTDVASLIELYDIDFLDFGCSHGDSLAYVKALSRLQFLGQWCKTNRPSTAHNRWRGLQRFTN